MTSWAHPDMTIWHNQERETLQNKIKYLYKIIKSSVVLHLTLAKNWDGSVDPGKKSLDFSFGTFDSFLTVSFRKSCSDQTAHKPV